MKLFIATLLTALFMITTVRAQIKLPKINTKTGQLIAKNKSVGLKVDLSKVKSLKDLQGLNIPRFEISPKKLAERSKKSWKVHPWRMTNGTLVISRMHGVYQDKKIYYAKFSNL